MPPLNHELFACAVTGKPGPIGGAEFLNALAGAVIVELALAGRVEIADDGEVRVVDATPTGDPLADEALADLPEALDAYEAAGRGRRLAAIAPGFVPNAYTRTYDAVIEAGLVEAKKDKLLGMISRERLELTPAGEEVRAGIRPVLLGESQPEARQAALVSLLAVAKAAGRQVPSGARKEAEARAEEIAAGDTAGTEIAEAVRSVKVTAASLIAR